MSIWLVLLIIAGITAGIILLFELSKRNEKMRIIAPSIILALLAAAINNPSNEYAIKFVIYTIGFIFAYFAINAYKRIAEKYSKKDKDV